MGRFGPTVDVGNIKEYQPVMQGFQSFLHCTIHLEGTNSLLNLNCQPAMTIPSTIPQTDDEATSSRPVFSYTSYQPSRAGKKRLRKVTRPWDTPHYDDLASMDQQVGSESHSSHDEAWEGQIRTTGSSRGGSRTGQRKTEEDDLDRLLCVLEGRRRTLMEQKIVWESWIDQIEATRSLLMDEGEGGGRCSERGSEMSLPVIQEKIHELSAALDRISLDHPKRSDPPRPSSATPHALSTSPEPLHSTPYDSPCPVKTPHPTPLPTTSTRSRIRIICLGIGKPSESREAQFQFSFLLLLARLLNVRMGRYVLLSLINSELTYPSFHAPYLLL